MSSNLYNGVDGKLSVPGTPTESVKPQTGGASNSFNLVASAVGDVPSLLFDSKEDREKAQPSSVEEFARSKARTPVDGLAKGIAALGGSLVKGLTGVVTEPIRGASENGAEGFFSGVGKGLLGVVFKPIGGVLEFGGKVGEGIVNTPETLGLVRSSEYVVFGIPLLDSFEKCKETSRRHVFLRIMDVLSDQQRAKAAEGLFVYGTAPKLAQEIANAYDQALDPDLITIDPFISVALLYKFLERLPEPLIPVSLHASLSALIGMPGRLKLDSPNIKRANALLSQLPAVNEAVLAELCLAIRKYLFYSGSGSIVLDHISLHLGRHILRTGLPSTESTPSEAADETHASETAPIKKPDFATPELKQFTLNVTRNLIQFFCPGYLTYQLGKSEFVLEL